VLTSPGRGSRRPNLAEGTFWQDQNRILITGKGQDFSYEIDLDAEYSMGSKLDAEQAIVCHYAVKVKSIAEAVSRRIHLLSHQQKGAALYEKAVHHAEPRWLKVGVAEKPGEGVAFSKIELRSQWSGRQRERNPPPRQVPGGKHLGPRGRSARRTCRCN
jgi:hypothetical protein